MTLSARSWALHLSSTGEGTRILRSRARNATASHGVRGWLLSNPNLQCSTRAARTIVVKANQQAICHDLTPDRSKDCHWGAAGALREPGHAASWCAHGRSRHGPARSVPEGRRGIARSGHFFGRNGRSTAPTAHATDVTRPTAAKRVARFGSIMVSVVQWFGGRPSESCRRRSALALTALTPVITQIRLQPHSRAEPMCQIPECRMNSCAVPTLRSPTAHETHSFVSASIAVQVPTSPASGCFVRIFSVTFFLLA